MQHKLKECLSEFLQAQKGLRHYIVNQDDEVKEAKLSQVIDAAINLKCSMVSGKRVNFTNDIHMVRYRELSKINLELIPLYDIFMSFRQLPLFSSDPTAYLLRNRVLAVVYIFGLNEDFAEYIAPYILKLESYGINMICYFGLIGKEYTCIDPVDYTHYLIDVVSEPINVRSMKREAISSRVCDISSLSQIRSLKNLVNLL